MFCARSNTLGASVFARLSRPFTSLKRAHSSDSIHRRSSSRMAVKYEGPCRRMAETIGTASLELARHIRERGEEGGQLAGHGNLQLVFEISNDLSQVVLDGRCVPIWFRHDLVHVQLERIDPRLLD